VTEPSADVREIQLTTSEESPLIYYFGEGVTISERSTSGAMLATHSQYNELAIKHENDLRAGRVRTESRVPFERLGYPELEYGKPGRLAVFDDRGSVSGYEDTRDPVLNRGGEVIGYADQETVEIRHEEHAASGVAPNIGAMMRWADIDKVMRAMVALDPRGPLAFSYLQLLYGAQGERFRLLSHTGEKCFRSHGRIAALYSSMPHGQRLLQWDDELRRDRGQPPSQLSTQERMEAELRGQPWTKPSKGRYAGIKSEQAREIRRALIERARRQAERESWIACWAWRDAYSASLVERKGERPKWIDEMRGAGR